MIRVVLFISFLFISTICQGATYTVTLGNEEVKIQYMHHGNGNMFVHLHQNETTALKAAQWMVTHTGGGVLTLKHTGGRNIVFFLNHKRYEFDPNRIFSDNGIKQTLQTFGSYSPEAHKQVKKLANAIKGFLPNAKIIAVHNNKQYSFKNYLSGHNLAGDAQDINFVDKYHYRNFFLVTQPIDYNRLSNSHFNCILQTPHAHDDGSLSVLFAKHQYINVEAGYNQLEAQINMLKHA